MIFTCFYVYRATAFLLMLFGASAVCMAQRQDSQPNFIVILVDDMGYGDPSCYGNTEARTPHIDRLATDGTKFTSFYAQTVCGPSRGALMTGRYPHRVGGGWTTNADEVFVSEVLKPAGYTTGCVGKWDMSKRRYIEDLVPNAQGFDYYYGAPRFNGFTVYVDDTDMRSRIMRNEEVVVEADPPEDMAALLAALEAAG